MAYVSTLQSEAPQIMLTFPFGRAHVQCICESEKCIADTYTIGTMPVSNTVNIRRGDDAKLKLYFLSN